MSVVFEYSQYPKTYVPVRSNTRPALEPSPTLKQTKGQAHCTHDTAQGPPEPAACIVRWRPGGQIPKPKRKGREEDERLDENTNFLIKPHNNYPISYDYANPLRAEKPLTKAIQAQPPARARPAPPTLGALLCPAPPAFGRALESQPRRLSVRPFPDWPTPPVWGLAKGAATRAAPHGRSRHPTPTGTGAAGPG